MRRFRVRALPDSDGSPGYLAPAMRPQLDGCQTVPLGIPNYDRNALDRPIRVGLTLPVHADVAAGNRGGDPGARTRVKRPGAIDRPEPWTDPSAIVTT